MSKCKVLAALLAVVGVVVSGQNVQVSGIACPGTALALYNGIWVFQGVAAGGKRFYQKAVADGDDGIVWMYFDSDCAGDGLNTSLWVMDANTPNVSRVSDLDDSGDCAVDAFIRFTGSAVVPPTGTWEVACSPGVFTSMVLAVSNPRSSGDDDGLGTVGIVYLTGSVVLLVVISSVMFLNREKIAEILPFSSPISSDRSSPIVYA